MKLTKDQMGFVLSMAIYVRKIGWSFAVCSGEAKKDLASALKYWPGACDFTMNDILPEKKDMEEVKEIVNPCPVVEPQKRRRSRKVRVSL